MTTSAALEASFKASFAFKQQGTSSFEGPKFEGSISDFSNFVLGTGLSQANLIYAAERTVASGANDDLDLNGTGLQTPLGANIAATSLVGIIIINRPLLETDPANTTNLTVGAGTNPVVGFMGGTTPTIIIRPNGVLYLECPSVGGIATITPSTGDILRIANAAGAQNKYQIALLMRG